MSVSTKERRRCDICKELIVRKYYSCSAQSLSTPCLERSDVGAYWFSTGGISPVSGYAMNSGEIDVCEDCWNLMKKQETV